MEKGRIKMNLAETYVKNITYISPPEEHGYRTLIADTYCYGIVEKAKKLVVSEEDYKSILENGFYMT